MFDLNLQLKRVLEHEANGALTDMVMKARYEGKEDAMRIASETVGTLEISGKKTILKQEKVISSTRSSPDPYSTITCLDDESQHDNVEDVTTTAVDNEIFAEVGTTSKDPGTTLARSTNSKKNDTSILREKTSTYFDNDSNCKKEANKIRRSDGIVSKDGPDSDNEVSLSEQRRSTMRKKAILSNSTSVHSKVNTKVHEDVDSTEPGIERRSIRKKQSSGTNDGPAPKRISLLERMKLHSSVPRTNNVKARLTNNDEDSSGDSDLSKGSDRQTGIFATKASGDTYIVDLTVCDDDTDSEVEIMEPTVTAVVNCGKRNNINSGKRPVVMNPTDRNSPQSSAIKETAKPTSPHISSILPQPSFSSSTNINNINEVMSQRIRKKDKVRQDSSLFQPISSGTVKNKPADGKEFNTEDMWGRSRRGDHLTTKMDKTDRSLLDTQIDDHTQTSNVNDLIAGGKKNTVVSSERLHTNVCQKICETTDYQVSGKSKRPIVLGPSDEDSKSAKRSRNIPKTQIVDDSSSKQNQPNFVGKIQIDDDGEICLGTRINLHARVRWIRHPFRSSQKWLPGFVYRDLEELLGDCVTSTCQSFHAFLDDRVSKLSSIHQIEKHVFGLAFDGRIYNLFMLPSDSFPIPDGLKLRPFSDTSIYDDLDLTDVNGGFISAVKMIHGMLNK